MIAIYTNRDLIQSSAGKSLKFIKIEDLKIDSKNYNWAEAIIYIDNNAFIILKSRNFSNGDINHIDKLKEFIEITLIRSLGQSNFIATKK